jgi:microcystin-dependent protein
MEPYIGEIRMFAGNYAPENWAFCDGSLLPIRNNTALFSILGTTYGGNGTTIFALPDLRGRTPMHYGTGIGLTPRYIGEPGGNPNVQLTLSETPLHTHAANCVAAASNQTGPAGAVWANSTGGRKPPDIYSSKFDTAMSPQAIGLTGGNIPHNNMQPYLGINYIISLQGIYPPRQ